MEEKMFWIGAVVLVVGVVLLAYCYSTIQYLKDSEDLPHSRELKRNWDLANLFQPISLGMIVLGAIILPYSLLVKKENK